MRAYVTLDLETTGLQPDKDTILEIGAIKVVEGSVADTYATFVDPRREIPSRITEITGITGDMVAGQPGIESALPRLLEFCGDYPLLGRSLLFSSSFFIYYYLRTINASRSRTSAISSTSSQRYSASASFSSASVP